MIIITSDGTYTVVPGETYVISSSVDDDVEFEYDGSSPAPVSFNIVIDDSNSEKFEIVSGEDLQPTLTIADGVEAPEVSIDFRDGAETTVDIGNGVSLRDVSLSVEYSNTVTIGDDFYLDSGLLLGDSDDTVVIGDNAEFVGGIALGDGDNNFQAGDNIAFGQIDGGQGTDTVSVGTLNPTYEEFSINLSGGNDTVSVDLSNVDQLDGSINFRGEGGTDKLNLQGLSNAHAQQLIDAMSSAASVTIDDNGTPADFTDDTVTGSNIDINEDLTGATFNVEAQDFEEFTAAAVCFAQGTQIQTANGRVAVEDLAVGDKIVTMDHGLQPIRWIGSRKISAHVLKTNLELRPVRISAGAMGMNLPQQDLLVSRQHRMLVKSRIAERMFDSPEVLVSAIKLCAMPGIYVDEQLQEVEYFHMLFDTHQVVYANGTPSESLFTGPEALKSLSPEAQEEITTLFPEICTSNFAPTAAREIPPGKLQKKLLERHLKSEKDLLAAAQVEG